ncbi:MAG: zinc ABC transporter substrate-binding protein [Methanobacteriota archaeon]|nr:MAG: zinc ABC transporter substrate-binding protein [Euryarchaeota archaeon]
MGRIRSQYIYGRAISLALALLISVPVAAVDLADAEDEVIKIVCTNSALADFAINLAGNELTDSVLVEFIMPAGACPSHFDASPSDVAMIASADIVISLGWEPWLADLLDASGNEDAQTIACIGLGEWNIPSGAADYLNAIANGLTEHSPEWAETLSDNSDGYSAEIASAYESYRLELEALGLNGTKVITIEWYSIFLTGLGFDVIASYGAPEGLSTADVVEIMEKCDDPEVAIVVDNLQSTVDFGANLAAEFGKEHVILSNFPGAIPGKYSYLDNLAYNVEELINAATAFEDTKSELSELESKVTSLELQRLVLASVVAVMAILFAISVVISRRRIA